MKGWIKSLRYSTLLKDYEKKEAKAGIVPKLTKYIKFVPTEKQQAFLLLDKYPDVFFGGSAGPGKILANEGVILTPFGWKKGIDLKIGDLVNNPDGSIQKIIQIKPEVHLDRWRVYFADRTYTDVAEDHLWLAWKNRKSKKIKNKRVFGIESAEVVETKEMLNWIKRGYRPQIPVCAPQAFNWTTKEKNRLDPYLLGVLLGDGTITRSQNNIMVTCHNDDKIFYRKVFGDENINYDIKKGFSFKGNKNKYIKQKLELYNLLGTKSHTKFIPDVYKYSSIKIRKEILRGLMDTDGYNDPKDNGCYYYTTSHQLSKDVAFIVRSLGAVVTISSKIGKYKNAEGKIVECKRLYILYIKTKNSDDFFKMDRKKHSKKNINISRAIIDIKIVGKIKGRCITVSNPNGLYITNDFIVTHNSCGLLMAALQYIDVPGYNALLIRDKYTNLVKPGGLVPLSHEWLHNTDAHWSGEKKIWTFPNRATLSFGHLDGPNDHFNYQGPEYQYIGIDEMVGVRENQALYLFSRLRKILGKNCPIRFRGASNPPTREQLARGAWVKRRYVDPKTRKPGVIFLAAWMTDNPHLDIDEYRKSLANLDAVTRAQLEKGDWNVKVKGKMFDFGWFKIIDVLPVDIKSRVRYWDFAATEKRDDNNPCYTVGVRMSKTKQGIYIVENVKRIQDKPKAVDNLVLNTANLDGKKTKVWAEQEPGSSGKMVIDYYTRLLAGYTFKGDRVTGSKIERAGPFSSQAEAGNVWILKGPWNEDYLEELELFPDGEFKDQTDASSGAFDKLSFGNNRARSSVVGEDDEQSIIDKILEAERNR